MPFSFNKGNFYKGEVIYRQVVANHNLPDGTCDLLYRYTWVIAARTESTIASFCARYGHLGGQKAY